MMNRILNVILLNSLFVCFSIASYSQIYSGKLINKESGKPVSYANIGIVDRDIGTVSDTAGWFEIELIDKYDEDSLLISCIGYKSERYLISDFKDAERKTVEMRIELAPISYHLNEVIIRPIQMRTYTLGFNCDSNSAYGNAFYSKELGTEMGVVIELPSKKDKAYLKNFRFYVGEFTFDKFPVRINVYDLNNGIPGKNILREPIYMEITSTGEYVINLSEYNITVFGNFFISLEYYRVPDKTQGKLVFCAVHQRKMKKKNSFYRWTSQGNWQSEMFDVVGFSVEVDCTQK